MAVCYHVEDIHAGNSNSVAFPPLSSCLDKGFLTNANKSILSSSYLGKEFIMILKFSFFFFEPGHANRSLSLRTAWPA